MKKYDKTHKTAMIYMSDHGESLGENRVYLHGLPYFMAPDAQTHVDSFMWFGSDLRGKFDIANMMKHRRDKHSHDNLCHTIFGLFCVKTKAYNKELDILNGH